MPTTGISQKDTESIREVIHQLRAGLPEVEVLLASGVFGMVDPRDPEALAKASHSGTGAYGQALKNLAVEENCAYLDMTTPWAERDRAYRHAIFSLTARRLMRHWGGRCRSCINSGPMKACTAVVSRSL